MPPSFRALLTSLACAGAYSVRLLAQQPETAAAPPPKVSVEELMKDPVKRDAMIRGFIKNSPEHFPKPVWDTTPPTLPAALRPGGILVFSKTNGFRDGPAIQASNAALAAIATRRGWPFFQTENAAVMNSDRLNRFHLLVWNNNSGDALTEPQRAAVRSWVEAGGSVIGIHGAGGDPTWFPPPHSAAVWKWYVDTLWGAQFMMHSEIMPGDIHIEDTASPITKGLPEHWQRKEEWYAFEQNPREKPGFHIIAKVDEKTYTPGIATMGADHPLIWWHCVGKGHVLYSALGHAAEMYSEPLIVTLLENSMDWGLDQYGQPCPAS